MQAVPSSMGIIADEVGFESRGAYYVENIVHTYMQRKKERKKGD